MNNRELLEKCARACDINGVGYTTLGDLITHWTGEESYEFWNPLEYSDDCAEMCAQLMIDTEWYVERVTCLCFQIETGLEDKFELYADHNNDRLAAWRHAACQVAAMMGERV